MTKKHLFMDWLDSGSNACSVHELPEPMRSHNVFSRTATSGMPMFNLFGRQVLFHSKTGINGQTCYQFCNVPSSDIQSFRSIERIALVEGVPDKGCIWQYLFTV